ncbi:hypothetical protein D6V26_20325 [Vibrio cholerae]|nr:hypothetical protein [Vibrio cholerae]
MTKKRFPERLPILARRGYERKEPNQFIAFSNDMLSKLNTKNLFLPAITLLLQLKADQRIQYVLLEETQYRQDFLEIGLIKETKKVGADRYVVPKTAVYVGIE